jgi:hypothetical protein
VICRIYLKPGLIENMFCISKEVVNFQMSDLIESCVRSMSDKILASACYIDHIFIYQLPIRELMIPNVIDPNKIKRTSAGMVVPLPT